MKILQIFGAVVAVHLLAFIFIFASPGCQSGPRNIPTPDATMPQGGTTAAAPMTFNIATPQPVDLGTAPAYNPPSAGTHAAPTRPGSANAVAVTPAKPTAEVTSINTYTVTRGDSMYTIAKKHGLTVTELAKANNLSAGVVLQPGKKLIIPLKPGATPPAAATTTPAAPRDLGTLTQAKPAASGEVTKHTVAPNESLSVIAKRYGVTLQDLAVANSIRDPQNVRAGQVLVIPSSKGASAPKSSTTAKAPASTPAKSTSAAAKAPATNEIPSVSTSTAPAAPAASAPHFEIAPPPPGQDLDAGLKAQGTTEVPTIKVEDKNTPPKN